MFIKVVLLCSNASDTGNRNNSNRAVLILAGDESYLSGRKVVVRTAVDRSRHSSPAVGDRLWSCSGRPFRAG